MTKLVFGGGRKSTGAILQIKSAQCGAGIEAGLRSVANEQIQKSGGPKLFSDRHVI